MLKTFDKPSVSVQLTTLPFGLKQIQNIDFPHKLGLCERIFGKSLSQYGVCWIKTGGGLSWKLDLANATHRWIAYGKYEGAPFINWAKTFLPRNAVVVDSGANIGQMLLYLAQSVPDGKVLAFEPDTEAVDWLTECLQVHSHLPVEIIRSGLGATNSQLFLKNLGEDYDHGAQNQISHTEGTSIQISALGEQLHQRGIECVDLWVLDVEGYEVPALEGASQLLREKKIRALYVELNGENGQRIQSYLNQFDYHCHDMTDCEPKLMTQPLADNIHINGLFIPG